MLVKLWNPLKDDFLSDETKTPRDIFLFVRFQRNLFLEHLTMRNLENLFFFFIVGALSCFFMTL
jgi:hypothetical protein